MMWKCRRLQEVNAEYLIIVRKCTIHSQYYFIFVNLSLSKEKAFVYIYTVLLHQVISQCWLNYNLNYLFLTFFFSVRHKGQFRWITDATSGDIPEFSSE